jgi:hypothetical protein
LFLASAVAWVAVLLAVGLIAGDTLPWALASAAVVGVTLAAAMTVALRVGERMQKRALGDVSPEFRQAAIRAAQKGPAPTDPGLRAAALRLAEQNFRRSRWPLVLLMISGSVLVVAEIVLAIREPDRSLLLLALVTVVLPISLLLNWKRLRARIRVLSEPHESVEQ